MQYITQKVSRIWALPGKWYIFSRNNKNRYNILDPMISLATEGWVYWLSQVFIAQTTLYALNYFIVMYVKEGKTMFDKFLIIYLLCFFCLADIGCGREQAQERNGFSLFCEIQKLSHVRMRINNPYSGFPAVARYQESWTSLWPKLAHYQQVAIHIHS